MGDYERLIRPIEDRLIRTIWRIVQDEHDAEDTLQNALERVWGKLDSIRRHPNPHALILRLCINAAYDTLRRKARARPVAVPETLSDPAPGILDRLQTQEDHAEVLQAIGRLSRRQGAAILLRFAAEATYAEIARVLGCSESAVRTHVGRGRQRLRGLLAHLST